MNAEQAMTKYGEALKERLTADKTYRGEPMTDQLPAVFTVPKYKKYLEWIITSYLSGGIRYFEDIASKVYPALNMYMTLLSKKKLYTGTPGEPWTNQTVITNYCGLLGCEATRKGKTFKKTGLYAVLDWYEEQEREPVYKPSAESRFFDGENIRIYKLHNEQEACYYGRGTKWCTAATKGENMYEDYAEDGTMYVIIPKKPRYNGEKYQLLVEHKGVLGDLMNERDEDVAYGVMYNMYPEVAAAISEFADYERYGYRRFSNRKYQYFEFDTKVDKHKPEIISGMLKGGLSSIYNILVERTGGEDRTLLVIQERVHINADGKRVLSHQIKHARGAPSDAIKMLIAMSSTLLRRSYFYAGLYLLFKEYPEEVLELVPYKKLRRAANSKHTNPEFKTILPPEVFEK